MRTAFYPGRNGERHELPIVFPGVECRTDMGRPRGNRTVTLELLVSDDLKPTICHAFGPRKYAWILERVAAAAKTGDFDRLADELAEASAPRPTPRPGRLDHARRRLIAMLVDRMRSLTPPPTAPLAHARKRSASTLAHLVARRCGVTNFDVFAATCRRLGIDIIGRMSPISDVDAERLLAALRP